MKLFLSRGSKHRLSLLLKVIYSVQQYYVQPSIKSSLYSVNKSKSTTHSFFQLVALGWEVAKPKGMLGLPQGRLLPHPPPYIYGGRISIRAKAYPFSIKGQGWVVKPHDITCGARYLLQGTAGYLIDDICHLSSSFGFINYIFLSSSYNRTS
jgi:hypothetical protein